MYSKLTDVPADIRSFYREEVRKEQVLSDNGESKLVDVTYVIENAPTEFKTLEDVWRVAGKHKGKRDDVIELFVGMVGDSEQYFWFGKYKQWLAECDVINEANTNKVADDEGVMPDDIPLPAKPVQPAVIDFDQWKLDNYEKLRQCAMPDKATQMQLMYEDMTNGTTKFKDLTDAIKAQYPDK